MKKEIIEKITKVAEAHSWSLSIDGKEFEFKAHSPGGQEFCLIIDADNVEELIDGIYAKYSEFDPSEAAYLWLDKSGHGKNGAPYNMKDVYEDMETCQEMMLELYYALTEAKVA